MLAYNVYLPQSIGWLLLAFVLSTISFTALGVLLGAVLPTARTAQGGGFPLFLVMMLVSGSAPPVEVLSGVLRRVGEMMPLRHVIILQQDPWLGFGGNATEFFIVAGVTAGATALSFRFFRWE